jgi:hypothetical protein
MKSYTLFFAFYPFNMEGLVPEKVIIEAENLEEAFTRLYEIHGGSDKIEIFKQPARDFYKE